MNLSTKRYPVPKRLIENLRFRKHLLEAAEKSVKIQSGLMEACRNDIFFFINAFVLQVNPAKVAKELGPFITWDFQEQALKETLRVLMDVRDEMIWEKSREMGATWMALILALWLAMFHPHKRILLISYSEQAVDKSGNEGSLFSKLDFIVEHLPKWMKKKVKRRRLGFSFGNRSSISGFASTGRSSVGDRATFIILDEFSKQQHAREILGQTKDVGPCLIIGTHYGVGTVYYDLTRDTDRHKIIFHWSQHPDKQKGAYRYDPLTNRIVYIDKNYEHPQDYVFNMEGGPLGGPFPGLRSPWYDNYCRRAPTDRDVAMHQDIDPAGSVENVFPRVLIEELMRRAVDPYLQGDILCDGMGDNPRFVPRDQGPLRLWCNLDLDGNPPKSRYGAGADISFGTGNTPSCWSAIDSQTGVKSVEYVNSKMAAERFAVITAALCRWFHNALFAWEANGAPGRAFWVGFQGLGYSNIYYRETKNAILGSNTNGYQFDVNRVPGWFKDRDAISELIMNMIVAYKAGKLTNWSRYALEDHLAFNFMKDGKIDHSRAKNQSDFSASNENHGDISTADGLALKMAQSLGTATRVAPPQNVLPNIYTLAGRRAVWEQKRRKSEAYD